MKTLIVAFLILLSGCAMQPHSNLDPQQRALDAQTNAALLGAAVLLLQAGQPQPLPPGAVRFPNQTQCQTFFFNRMAQTNCQ